MISDELIIDLHRIGAIKFGRFKLTSGMESPIYIDLRLAITHPELYGRLVKAITSELDKYEFDAVAGIETAGIPWASMIAYEMGKGLVYVRKEAKEHGTSRLVEGDLRPGMRFLVVDDVITTGGSIIRAIRVLRSHGGSVVGAAALVDRGQGGVEAIRREGVIVITLLKLSDILNVLLNKGVIDRGLYDEVMDYLVNVRAS